MTYYHHLEISEGDRFYRRRTNRVLALQLGIDGAWVPCYGRNVPLPRDLPLASEAEFGLLEALLDVAAVRRTLLWRHGRAQCRAARF